MTYFFTCIYVKIKKQDDIKDCGIFVLQALHKKYHHKWLDINDMKANAQMSSLGMNVLSLIKLGKHYGFAFEGFRVDIESLIQRKNEDMIALVSNHGMNHYIIINYDGEVFQISDPAKGEYSLTEEEFKNIFEGIVLTFTIIEHTPEFIKKDFSPYYFIFKNIHLMTWIIISLILAVIFSFSSSLFMKIIFDFVIPGRLLNTLTLITIGFIFLGILRSINDLFKKYLSKKLSLIVEFELKHLYFQKIKDASISDINKLTRQDHLRRISLIPSVAAFISTGIFIVFNETIIFIIAFVLLLWVNPLLFGIAFIGASLAAISMFIFQFFLKDKYSELLELQLESFQNQIDYVFSQKELKEAKKGYHQDKLTQNSFKAFKTSEMTVWRALNLQELIDSLIIIIIPIVLTYFSVHMIFGNKLTIGSMLLFLSIFHFFISPMLSLCDFGVKLNQNLKNLHLVSYTINLQREEDNQNGLKLEELKSISLEHVSFGYDQPLINIKELIINSSVHIESPNGTGKSTLLNILAARISINGEIKYNKFAKEYYSLNNLRDQIFFSSPNTYIPSMSILEYITLSNQDAVITFQENARKYNLLDLFQKLNLSLETKIENNADNLSSGQKQFVILMSLFAYKYQLIILDEALENLDKEIVKKLRKYICNEQKALFVEVSHSKKYISKGKVVNFEQVNSHTL